MDHKTEITIKDEKLWKALCKYSAISKMPVSEIVDKIGTPYAVDVFFKRSLEDVMVNDERSIPVLCSELEIKDYLDGQ